MRIGIDISQLAYENTGVANYLQNLVSELLRIDKKNEYVLFFSSLRNNSQFSILNSQSNSNIIMKKFRIPPKLLDLLWNKLHIAPIEWFIGDVDIFITSDWTEPPAQRAKKATILYDLIVYRCPNETDKRIVAVQKRKLEWVKKESDIVFCISESTAQDAVQILGIDKNKLNVVYPGL
ncbi:glycosyltransferase [Patescibacteria group bacterium]|nr:glycosyltransferase [Patescibacteria group bacterium]